MISARQRVSAGLTLVSAFTLVLTLTFTACGYHTSAHNVILPSEVRTLAIPAFLNQTQTYKVEQTLTKAVVREFTTRTKYHIVFAARKDEGADADATLRGTVLSATTAPATYDSKSGRASTELVTVKMHITLTDRQGKVLFENPEYTFREEYQVSGQLSSFFEEESPALDRLARSFARSLVSNVLEGF